MTLLDIKEYIDEHIDDDEEVHTLSELRTLYTEILEHIESMIDENIKTIKTITVEREFTLEEMNKGFEYCTYKAHRELIKRLLELKLIDIKSMNDIFGKGTVEFRLKVVEPYERR